MNIRAFRTLWLVVALALSLAACAGPRAQADLVSSQQEPAAPAATLTPAPSPTPTPRPTATQTVEPTPSGPWTVLAEATYTHRSTYTGFLDETFGLTVGYAGEVHYTHDGGQSWSTSVSSSACRFGLEIIDAQTAIHCGNLGHVRLSVDGGKKFSAVTSFGRSEPAQCRYLSFIDATTGWAAAPGQLGVTTDGAQTWTELALPDDMGSILAISLYSASQGYLLDDHGLLFVTTDGGQTWTSQVLNFLEGAETSAAPSPRMAMRFGDGGVGMIVYQRGNLDEGFYTYAAHTAVGGETWTEEQVPVGVGIPNLYLARDGVTLTASNAVKKTILVLRYVE
ncbi:MAG: hypothetical protein EHM70_06855 [Chloroflexota bacterium]|nr:MAG: hypothetical protein EHM70_06855 [Chloroflexota bacterium]